MTKRAAVIVGAAALLAVAPAAPARPAEAAKRTHTAAGLKAFGSCNSLLRYARRNAIRRLEPAIYGPLRRRRPAPRPLPLSRGQIVPESEAPQQGFSGTNVQEAGIDEPDIVKTDGAHIFAVAEDKLHAVDVTGPVPRRVGTLRLGSRAGSHDLILRGGRLLVVSRAQGNLGEHAVPLRASIGDAGDPKTVLSEVDVSSPASMRVVRTLTVKGSYVSARLSAGMARVVISTSPRGVAITRAVPPSVDGLLKARRRNRAALRRSRLSRWVPSYTLRDRRTRRTVTRRLVRCRAVRRATTFSGLGMLSVLTIDLDRGLPPTDSDALMTDADTVYGSPGGLYVATPRWMDDDLSPERQARGMTTQIHRFEASALGTTTYRSSGRVRGFLLNQFSLSEHAGYLRVASTSEPVESQGGRDGDSESFVTVLAEQGGQLIRVGRLGGLGRGERIYSVRFIGDSGYVVTFRQVDPLYAIDLSQPQAPKVLGELKIRGYSAYLHPIEGNLLIGVGQDATRRGRRLGTQLSLFDVSDLRNPRRLHRHTLASSMSEVEFDHHAFLWWGPARLAVLPVAVDPAPRQPSSAFNGAIGFRIGGDTGIAEAGRIVHGSGRRVQPVRRSIVVGERLYTVSDAGIAANALDTFGRLGFVSFR